MTNRKPINVKVWKRATTLAAENVLSRNSAKGSIGLLVVFSLISKNRKKSILAAYAAIISGDVLPRLFPSIKAKVNIPRTSTLASPHHVMQCFHRLLDWGLIIPAMDLVEVHVIRPKPLEALVDLTEDRLAR